MKTVFICSPYRGRVIENEKKARDYCLLATKRGFTPIASHLLFTQFLDESNPDDRIKGLTMSREVLKRCDEIWVFGPVISKGMGYEISAAKEYGIPFRLFHENGQAINPRTMDIDDRVERNFAIDCSGHNVVYAEDGHSRLREKGPSFWDKVFG